MFINILSFNVFLYNGYGKGYKTDRTVDDKYRTHNNLFKKMFDIININNINVVFLQEDNQDLEQETKKKFEKIGFKYITSYPSDNNEDKTYIRIINSIYIKESFVSNIPNENIINDYLPGCYS